MIIICPNCQTRYNVNAASLGQGRKVRCANCGHRWYAEPEVEIIDEDDDDDLFAEHDEEPDQEQLERIVQQKIVPPNENRTQSERRRGGAGRELAGIFAWLGVLALVLLLAGFVLGRNQIVAMFPQTTGIYQALGLPVQQELGLTFEALQSSRRNLADGTQAIVVTGEIHNRSDQIRKVPQIRVALLDGAEQELQFFLIDPMHDELVPDSITRFEAEFANPPEESRNFEVQFTSTVQ